MRAVFFINYDVETVMMLKKRIFHILIFVLIGLVLFVFEAVHQSKQLHRDLPVLMDKYYRLKQSHPVAANNALRLILQQDENYLPALKESSQWFLHENDLAKARPVLERLHQLLPDNDYYALQLGYVYYQQGQWQQALSIFSTLVHHANKQTASTAQQALDAMASFVPYYADYAQVSYQTQADLPRLSLRSEHSQVNQIFKKTVLLHNKHSLQQKGYHALALNQTIMAIDYFTKAYAQTHDPSLALQLGYIYDSLNNKPQAYSYFQKVTKSRDCVVKFKANQALTNLAGMQTKALPTPYFGELFFSPFTQTRFGLTVRPLVARVGVEQANRYRTKEYVFFRRTDDNRSENLGQISQIYEDDVEITGMGVQVTPLPQFQPLVGFFEAGIAYDLVYRDRDRFRSDFRGGLMYYQEFGKKPAFYDQLTVSHCYYSNWYADMTYFSRYNNNVIGGIRTHQGIRLLQYHSSMINLYIVGRVLGDTQHVFYNNYAEAGPAIAFIPSNRWNLQLRFEHVNGVYLPASAIPSNPYPKHYTNNILQLIFYVKL